MIYLITGVPGSGKTYFAVNFIYEQINLKEPKYKKIYTNINLNFNKCNKIKKDFVLPLDLDDLISRIEKDYELSELFKQNKLFDEETGEIVRDYDKYVRDKLKLFEPYEYSLIILDECHLYFTDKQDPKLLRFLSYHRHFDIDMFLITQNKSLINRKYLAFVENLYKGVNPSKRFFSKNFVYKVYGGYQEYKNNFVYNYRLKFNPKIASCYNSGSTKIPKSLSYKLIIPLILLIVFVFLIFKGYTNHLKCGHLICTEKKLNFNSEVKINNNNNLKEIKVNDSKNEKSSNKILFDSPKLDEFKFFYKFTCFEYKCISQDGSIIIEKSFIDNLNRYSDTFITSFFTGSTQTYFVATNFDLRKFMGVNYEKDNNSSMSIFN
ncbi:zonular occludens toxin domain-containing protein [Caminibacter mediatlanticus]|uniref:Phage-related membrane protein n=1 Tax=Caminibacter mediatlanticus TB-2 TaxID=391592 RepID=A0AAI9AFU4_9BACT|nr:zonular occludens toxin domain-containing protein [Caminibacter mediatlanticus]EDM22858.1 putative phage-related membrane protein [Caminibacter mediatlanticus TB-2]